MTSTLFQQWIESFDTSLLKKGKKVRLLLDDCSAHKVEDSALKCIELAYLSPNTTSSVQPLDQGIIKNFKHHYRWQMLQKIVLTIDSNEDIPATEVARSLSVLSAINFVSAFWTDVSKESIQNCFFRGLTPAVSDEPFLGFPPQEIPPAFTEKVYDEYVRIDDDLEVAGIQTDSELCDEVTQGREDNEEADESCDAVAIITPKNKEVLDALHTIRRRLNIQGMDMDRFPLEQQVLNSISENIKQTTIESYFNKNWFPFCLVFFFCVEIEKQEAYL